MVGIDDLHRNLVGVFLTRRWSRKGATPLMGEGNYIPGLTAGNPPPVEDGLALVRLDSISIEEHPDWAGTDSYGKADDGRRFHFTGTLVDETGAPVYDPNDDSGDPISLERLTRVATGKRSGYREQMTAIMSKAEFAAYEEASSKGEKYDASAIFGRVYNVKIVHSKSGWPQIED